MNRKELMKMLAWVWLLGCLFSALAGRFVAEIRGHSSYVGTITLDMVIFLTVIIGAIALVFWLLGPRDNSDNDYQA